MSQVIEQIEQQRQELAAEAGPPFDMAADRRLRQRAMLCMMLAMAVMAIGLPTHLVSLRGGSALHAAGGWTMLSAWLAGALTTITLWLARDQLALAWRQLWTARIGATAVVTLGAASAYALSLTTLLTTNEHASHRVFFDVVAMALAWLVAGAAQRSDLRRRSVVMRQQLALLGAERPLVDVPAAEIAHGWAGLAGLLLGLALLAAADQLVRGASVGRALDVLLTALTLSCPCALGIARASAYAAGAAQAARSGWIVADERAFWAADLSVAALDLGATPRATLDRIARRVRWAARLNTLWAIGLNLLALPLALRGSLDPLVPAGLMLLAWMLIGLTSRASGWHQAVRRR